MSVSSLEQKVGDFLAQRRIAVVGVSRDKGRHPIGNAIYQRLKSTGHEVFAVNPALATFEGDTCYANVPAIPGGVDGVVIITRPELTDQVVRDCGTAGVRRVWMHQSVAKGSSVSPDAVEYCRQHGITVIAGACPMMFGPDADLFHRCFKWCLGVAGKLPS